MLDAGNDGTHGRSGDAISIIILISFRKPDDAISMNNGEQRVLSCCAEIPRIRDSSSSDITARRLRGTSVPFPNDPQKEGRSCGRVVCFYDPRFVLLHANRDIITNLEFLIWTWSWK